jgi:hypothetical protein
MEAVRAVERIPDSSDGIANGYGMRFPAVARGYSTLHSVQTGSGAPQPPSQWVPSALSPRVKRPRSEADLSPKSSAEVKNGGAIPPLPHTSLWRSVRHARNQREAGSKTELFTVTLMSTSNPTINTGLLAFLPSIM